MNRTRLGGRNFSQGAPARSARSVRILFVHHDAVVVKRCLRELRYAEWIVAVDVVQGHQDLAVRLGLTPRPGALPRASAAADTPALSYHLAYDLVLAGYPHPHWFGSLGLLRQAEKSIPFVPVIDTVNRKSAAELARCGVRDWVEMDRVARLPAVVRRVLEEKATRIERECVEKDLRHSHRRLRGLVESFGHGIARCGPDGRFLEVDQALAKMLGYESEHELLAESRMEIRIPRASAPARASNATRPRRHFDPVELEWKRKDGTSLKVRCSGSEFDDRQAATSGYEIIAEDLTVQRALVDELRHRAAKDPLTGLANHRQFADVLEHEIQRSKRLARELTVLLLDLDGLKRINDGYGHVVGNRMICRMADILTDCCRLMDTPARFGGDEFVIVAPETGVEAAILFAQRISARCANDCGEPRLSASVGVASYPRDGETAESLLHAADRGLYKMKGASIRLRQGLQLTQWGSG